MVILNPQASILKVWIVFCLEKNLLFKSILAGCAAQEMDNLNVWPFIIIESYKTRPDLFLLLNAETSVHIRLLTQVYICRACPYFRYYQKDERVRITILRLRVTTCHSCSNAQILRIIQDRCLEAYFMGIVIRSNDDILVL